MVSQMLAVDIFFFKNLVSSSLIDWKGGNFITEMIQQYRKTVETSHKPIYMGRKQAVLLTQRRQNQGIASHQCQGQSSEQKFILLGWSQVCTWSYSVMICLDHVCNFISKQVGILLSYYLKGMPRYTISAAFLNIVQKAFDPPAHFTTPPFGLEHMVAFFLADFVKCG